MAIKKTYREVVGERLKEFRENRGITQEQVAKAGDMSVSDVQDVETGRCDYPVDMLFSYVIGSDLYMYFAEKTGTRLRPHDFEDLSEKGTESYPKK